jgi:hypothetical protein
MDRWLDATIVTKKSIRVALLEFDGAVEDGEPDAGDL